ncbi:hypothetical protein ACFP2T_36165, partial [Plantactinospora solaniradicis]
TTTGQPTAASFFGQIVISNATTQILLRQAPQAIDIVADVFGLSCRTGFLSDQEPAPAPALDRSSMVVAV